MIISGCPATPPRGTHVSLRCQDVRPWLVVTYARVLGPARPDPFGDDGKSDENARCSLLVLP
jgi:hypothetical protein